MIVDHIENWQHYNLGPVWEQVMTWLTRKLAECPAIEYGSHTIGESVVNVNSIVSKKNEHGKYEAHRKFCDIQIVLEGEEYFYTAPTKGLTLETTFDEERDVGFFAPAPAECTRIHLRPGLFALVFPWDAHMPGMAVNSPAQERKCVVKVPFSALNIS